MERCGNCCCCCWCWCWCCFTCPSPLCAHKSNGQREREKERECLKSTWKWMEMSGNEWREGASANRQVDSLALSLLLLLTAICFTFHYHHHQQDIIQSRLSFAKAFSTSSFRIDLFGSVFVCKKKEWSRVSAVAASSSSSSFVVPRSLSLTLTLSLSLSLSLCAITSVPLNVQFHSVSSSVCVLKSALKTGPCLLLPLTHSLTHSQSFTLSFPFSLFLSSSHLINYKCDVLHGPSDWLTDWLASLLSLLVSV